MSINILKAYIQECKKEGLEPTWEGLNIFKIKGDKKMKKQDEIKEVIEMVTKIKQKNGEIFLNLKEIIQNSL
ncbi:MAG: hypothetical protein KZY57_07370, partial [Paeniclostridium sp.]